MVLKFTLPFSKKRTLKAAVGISQYGSITIHSFLSSCLKAFVPATLFTPIQWRQFLRTIRYLFFILIWAKTKLGRILTSEVETFLLENDSNVSDISDNSDFCDYRGSYSEIGSQTYWVFLGTFLHYMYFSLMKRCMHLMLKLLIQGRCHFRLVPGFSYRQRFEYIGETFCSVSKYLEVTYQVHLWLFCFHIAVMSNWRRTVPPHQYASQRLLKKYCH